MIQPPNPDLDLTLSRVIKAPRPVVWSAWTDRTSFEQWWVPAPARCKVVAMELRPGGAFETLISEDGGDYVPHLSACFLDVIDGEQIVFTNALLGGWRPAENAFIDGHHYLAGASSGDRVRLPRDAQEQRRSQHARDDGLLRRMGHRRGPARDPG